MQFPTEFNTEKIVFRIAPKGIFQGPNYYEFQGDVALETTNFLWSGSGIGNEITREDIIEAIIEGLKVSTQILGEKSGRPDVFVHNEGVSLTFIGPANSVLNFDSTPEEETE